MSRSLKKFSIEDFSFNDDGSVEIDAVGIISSDVFDELNSARWESKESATASSNKQSTPCFHDYKPGTGKCRLCGHQLTDSDR